MNVLAILGELDAEPLERTAMQPREEPFDDRPRLELERAEPRDDGGIEKLPIARARRHAYIPLFGAGTASSSRSTMASELMRSDSA